MTASAPHPNPASTPAARPLSLRRRIARAVLAAVAIAAALVGAWLAAQRPSNDRVWVPEQSVLPRVAFAGSHVRIENVRDFRYSAPGRFTQQYDVRDFDLDSLESVWFVLTPFSKTWRGPAHSFVSFGFRTPQGPRYVAISIEARKEPGEVYGLWTGLARRFELMYVVGDERDLIGQRAVYGDYDVYLYPIVTTREKARAMFVEMLERANQLRAHPEFYNTATNNCTSNLVAHVNRITPHKVPIGLKTILPGYADEVARSVGLIDSTATLDALRAKYRINDRAKAAWASGENFSVAIRRP